MGVLAAVYATPIPEHSHHTSLGLFEGAAGYNIKLRLWLRHSDDCVNNKILAKSCTGIELGYHKQNPCNHSLYILQYPAIQS